MVKYRNRLEIIADILAVVKGGAGKTQVMYGANLSYTLLTRYLKNVVNIGLVKMAPGNTYVLTEKGSDFLREFTGYCEHLREVEGQLSDIRDRKMMLVNKFLNAEDAR